MKPFIENSKREFWKDRPRLYNFIQLVIDGNLYKKIVEYFPDFIERKSVLDLGCGTAQIITYLKPEKYLGLDANNKYLEYARKKFKNKTHVFKVGDLRNLRLPGKGFDLVFIMNVFHHLDNEIVNNVLGKLKKWGKYKYIVIVDCQPVGVLRKLIEYLDAGSYSRRLQSLDNLIMKHFKIDNKNDILNLTRTYKYRLYIIKAANLKVP